MVTAFISMWITNTATTAMMTPIMEAVLKQLDKQFEKPKTIPNGNDKEEILDEKRTVDTSGDSIASWDDELKVTIPLLANKSK